MIKKISFLLILFSLFVPLVSSAVSIPNPLKANTFTELLNSIIDFIFTISIPITALMIIIAGFYFITAQGEPEKIQTAKKIIIWTLIGFLIIVAAKGLVQLLMQVAGVR
ncbi:MAG: pilin [Candidatus Nealsonbacteria bacterium]